MHLTNLMSSQTLEVKSSILKILVVDDNRDSADSLGMLLELMGYTVAISYDGESAVKDASSFQPDYVLLDIGLPGMSGHDVARALRSNEILKAAKIIAVTGWGQDHDKEASKGAGFDFHLVKPVDIDQLTDLLQADVTA